MKNILDTDEVRFFSGRSNQELAAKITAELGLPLEQTNFARFSNDNLYIQLDASVRGRVVYIIQSLTPPVSDHLLELLMMMDIARGAAAREVHAIIPYYSYARSDKKNAPRISITGRLVADLLVTAGASHIMTMNLHSPQVHGFFSVPADPLTARMLFVEHFRAKELNPAETIVVAPDMGAAKPAARFAAGLGLSLAAANKTRLSDTTVQITGFVGRQVEGYHRAIIYDDEIATGGSMVELCRMLTGHGIEEITTVCTHGVFSGNSLERLSAVPQIVDIVTTDTVYIPPEKRLPHMTILSVASIFAEAIRLNYQCQSIGELFTYWDEET